ncbi:ABC transporter permease [Sedimentibacter sp. zth1]|uniref:ABC transporter permease n=1 Tax=Sedimentibacter sp. zth1 TaxID=2816908 RepID=UPI001A91950B|nr:ABC transporter permease [Sedimentibacter sp. zth1]QSX05862.1 ABC transporter permease [Sedimentibacter sp. zth1]
MMKKYLKFTNPYIRVGIVLIIIPIFLAIFVPVLAKYDPSVVNPLNRLQSPSLEHLMGTDDLGRDVFSRTLFGIRTSLIIGFAVTLISLFIGVFTGIVAAYYPITSGIIMRFIDGIMAFPTIIFAIALAGVLGSGITNIIVALAVSYFPMITRITRNAVLEVKEMEYVKSTISIGKNDLYIIFKCILPNIISPIIVQTTFTFAMAILNESILSFLGVGIQVPLPSLGGMVNDGRNYMMIAPWIIVFPGLTISWIVLALNIIGDGLRDFFDPKH